MKIGGPAAPVADYEQGIFVKNIGFQFFSEPKMIEPAKKVVDGHKYIGDPDF
jgi:hypothetical protein